MQDEDLIRLYLTCSINWKQNFSVLLLACVDLIVPAWAASRTLSPVYSARYFSIISIIDIYYGFFIISLLF